MSNPDNQEPHVINFTEWKNRAFARKDLARHLKDSGDFLEVLPDQVVTRVSALRPRNPDDLPPAS